MGHTGWSISSKNNKISVPLCKALMRPHLVILRSGKRNSDWNKNSLNGWKNRQSIRHGENKTPWLFNCSHQRLCCIIWLLYNTGVHAQGGKGCLRKRKMLVQQSSYKLAMNKFGLKIERRFLPSRGMRLSELFPGKQNNPVTFKLEQFVKRIIS